MSVGDHFKFKDNKMTLKTSIILSVLIICLVVDTTFGMIMDILYQVNIKSVFSELGLLLYLTIFAVYAIALYAIVNLTYVEQKMKVFPLFRKLRTANIIVNYFILTVLALLTIQIFFAKSYLTLSPIIIASLSYGLCILNFGVLSYLFLKWFKIYKNKIILIFCSLVFVMCFNAINSIIFFDSALILNTEPVIQSGSVPEYRLFLSFDPNQIIAISQSVSVAVYVSLTWIGIVFILKYNIRKIGKPLFFLLVIPPLLAVMNFHISSFSMIYPDNPAVLMLSPSANTQFMLYIMSFLLCAFLFGLGYISISRHIIHGELRRYTVITGLGFLLFYIAGFSTIINHGFPPFGLISLSLTGMSSYLILIGLHYTAISVSQDLRLRKSIKTIVSKDLEFFDSLGKAESIQGYQEEVMKLIHNNRETIMQDSGIETTLNIEEAKKYVEEIIVNLKKKKAL